MYVINTSLRFLFEGPHGTVLYTGNLQLFSEQVCKLLVCNFKDPEAENCSNIITCSLPSLSRCHVTFCYNYMYHDMYEWAKQHQEYTNVPAFVSFLNKIIVICNWIGNFVTFVAFQ